MLVRDGNFFSFHLKSYFYYFLVLHLIFSSNIFSGKVSASSVQNAAVPESTLSLIEKDQIIFDQIKTIYPLQTIAINVTTLNIPSGSLFLVIQVHAYNFNLTLSYNKTFVPHYHVNGTNIGLVVPVQKDQVSDVYVTNFNASKNVSALIAVLAYNINVPIPGGCNMVFPIETSPFLKVSYNEALVRVDFQPASPPINSLENCEFSSVEHEVYHDYFPERDFSDTTYFSAIRRMLTVDRIRNNGMKVNEPLDGKLMRRIFSAYTGTGSVYAIVAVFNGDRGRYESAYVPSVTYACSAVLWADSCQVLTTTFAKLLCAILFFVGLFVCLFGHRFFRIQIFIHSFIIGGVIAFLVLFPHLHSGLYTLSVCFALALGFMCLFFWHAFGLPFFHVIIISLNVGFLLASIVIYAGLGDVDLMDSDINYWITFLVLTLFAPALLVYVSQKACIIASGILGAYAVVVPIDHYVGSNLKFIILNTVRRATVPEFKSAVISPPYQFRDLTLTLVWLVLSIVGISLQLFLQRNRPPFPPPPSDFCGLLMCCSSSSRRTVDERTPLLVDARIPSRTPPEGYDDVFEPSHRPSAPNMQLLISK